jgi:hypothetical protein
MAVGVATALIMMFVWGSLRDVPVIHDGTAYLTQARTFASFHLYGPRRPLPEFFDQYHMLVTPRFLAKYPPGHSLMLVPGVWLGLPALMPVMLAGIAGALVFSLARDIANPWVAFITWEWWVTSQDILRFGATYLSQTTTMALWLVAWWALRRWWLSGRRVWLVLLGCCTGYGALTHPFTWLLFAIPTSVVVLVLGIRRRAWRDLALSAVAPAAAVALLMVWSLATVGSATTLPWSVYAREYLPADRIGFGADTTPAARPLPSDMQKFSKAIVEEHARHTVKALPRDLAARIRGIVHGAFSGWRLPLAPIALFGVLALSSEFSFALGTAATVVLGYLLYATSAGWTLYYLELTPVWSFAFALGLWQLASRARLPGESVPARSKELDETRRRAATTLVIIGVLLSPLHAHSVAKARSLRLGPDAEVRVFMRTVVKRFRVPSMVFVRYAPDHNVHRSFISNPADLGDARVWLVRDRGADDVRLIRLAPSREPFLYDEASHDFSRIDTLAVARLGGQ